MIIGISGISGAGKTTLIKQLEIHLKATSIHWDEYDGISEGPQDYVKWFETSKNYDDWKYDALSDVLKKLSEGIPVTCPATGRELHPTEHILFDAPLGYLHHPTGKYIDFLVLIDTPLDIALARRLLRDFKNHTESLKILDELEYYLSHTRPLFHLSQKEQQKSDLIIDGGIPTGDQVKQILNALKLKKPA